ncbi:hypothetical protein [uncultured Stenotrophomonas sp.]|nr:hypothetical protein [uncultured Stenotrophomonas sp.]
MLQLRECCCLCTWVVGARVMEGLKLAALALTSHAIYRLHPE